MLIRNVNYVDYNGQRRNEEYHFNISKTEYIKLNFTDEGSLKNTLDTLKRTDDAKRAYELIEKVVLLAYGVKDPNGKTFLKTEKLTNDFYQSPAFEALMDEFLQNSGKFAEFVEACVNTFITIDRNKPAIVDANA